LLPKAVWLALLAAEDLQEAEVLVLLHRGLDTVGSCLSLVEAHDLGVA